MSILWPPRSTTAVVPLKLAGSDAVAILALAVVAIVQFWDLVFRGLILTDYDVFVYFYPLRQFAADAVRQWGLPQWNPTAFMGTPFLANPQTALFYPLTALFYLLSVPAAYSASLVLHVFLAGAFFYAFARVSLECRPTAALLGAIAFMLSGFFVGQAGHLNQFSAAAWLPLMALAFDQAVARRDIGWAAAGGGVLALQLLAGHPQETYMSLVAVGVLVLGRSLTRWPFGPVRAALSLAIGLALGFGMAAVQLLPTLELTRESIRSGGLDYADAAFSALPTGFVPWALLPQFKWHFLTSTEFLGYVGIFGTVAALLGLVAARHWSVPAAFALAFISLFAAMGDAFPLHPYLFEYMPYFDRFRVPARWLLVYVLAVSALAALGTNWALSRDHPLLTRGRSWTKLARAAAVTLVVVLLFYWAPRFADPVPNRLLALWVLLAATALGLLFVMRRARVRWAGAALVGMAVLELWLAPMQLPVRELVPPDVFAMQRPSTRFLQAAEPGRILSVASDAYPLPDEPAIREAHAGLDPRSLQQYFVSIKLNEVLTPNLPTVYGLIGADGYDGGVLPMNRFVLLSELLIPQPLVRTDGVLRSRLEYVPPPRVLDVIGTTYVLAADLRDAQVDGVAYDRAHTVTLASDESQVLRILPDLDAAALGVVSAYQGPELPTGTLVAEIELLFDDGSSARLPVRLGLETGVLDQLPPEGQPGPRVLGRWFVDDQWDYHTRLNFAAKQVRELRLLGRAREGVLHVRALTLIAADNQHHPLVLDDRFDRERLPGVKVYALRDGLPLAHLVAGARVLDDAAALDRLRESSFDPRAEVVLAPTSSAAPLADQGDRSVQPPRIERPRQELIRVEVETDGPAYLVVNESWAPGWEALVDGRPAPLERANVNFQAVRLEAGQHLVELRYQTPGLASGAAISAAALLSGLGLLLASRRLERLAARWGV